MKKFVFGVLILLLAATPAMAKVTIELPAGYGQEEFKKLSTDLGLAISYVPLAPAEPLGGTLPGFDAGVEATAVKIDKNASYWDAVNAVSTDVPSTFVFPKVHIQVGLPIIPIDLGYVYAAVPSSDIKYMGGEIKYAILKGGVAMPALAIRGAYTKLSGIDVIDISTKSIDLSISKGFLMLTPYAGVAQVWISSQEKSPLVNLEKEDISETKAFVGLKVSLLPVFNIVAEGDFAAVKEYSFRMNLHF